MQLLIRAAKIIDCSSPHHEKVKDILITDGVFTQIGEHLDATGANEVIEGEDLCVSTGWVDLYATFGDPGKEYREDIESGLTAAAQGGFTKVALSPQTEPVVDNKSAIRYLLKKAENHVVDALPIGAITKSLKGEELAEMFDMQTSGAVAVSNGKHTLANTKLQNLALLYSKNLNMAFYTFCQDELLANGGQMHEGEMNTNIGLKGIPALAEEVVVARDLYLAEYSDVAVHFSHITTKGSVDLIRKAKAKGLKVTASVPAHHLSLLDEAIADFEPNYKVVPPFRSTEHLEALIAGVADGTIDSIISDHEPCEIEAKFSEFTIAEPGIIALETAFTTALKALTPSMALTSIIERFTSGPRSVLNLPTPTIKEGSEAEITIFTPSLKWTYTKSEIKSLSKNSPLIDQEITGLPVGIVNKGQLYLNS